MPESWTYEYWRDQNQLRIPVSPYLSLLNRRETESKLKFEVLTLFLAKLGKVAIDPNFPIKEIGINVFKRVEFNMIAQMQKVHDYPEVIKFVGAFDEKKAGSLSKFHLVDWNYNYLENGKRVYTKGPLQRLYIYVLRHGRLYVFKTLP